MKKIVKTFFFVLIIYLIFPTLINAATSLDTDNQRPVVGTSIDVTLRVDYGTNVKIGEVHYYVKYDPEALELEEINWTQSKGTSSYSNGIITLDKTTAVKEWGYGTPIAFKFKALKAGVSYIDVYEKSPGKYSDGSIISQSYSGVTINAVNPSTATKIGKLYVEGYTMSPTFNVDNYNYTLTVPASTTQIKVIAGTGEKNQTITGDGTRVLKYGDNRIRVVVTAQNGNSATYEIMVHRIDDRSGDVSLKKLIIGEKSIPIEAGKTVYETTVSRSVENIFLSAQTTDEKATLVGTGQKDLNIGENVFELYVSSKDEKEQIYRVIITRSTEEIQENVASAELSNLTINSINIPLEENKYKYIYSIENNIDELNIATITKSTTAKYKIEGNKELKTGVNIITITVTDSEVEEKVYTIIVYKQPKKTKKYENLDNLNNINELEDIYYSTQNPTIITKEQLNSLNNNKLKIYYNITNATTGILYQILIPYGEYQKDINTQITRSVESPLTFTTELPADLSLMIYVGDIYEDGTELKVYTYDEIGVYSDLTTSVKVVDGYVNITTNGQKNYVFSSQNMIGNTFNIMNYLPYIGIGIIILLLLIFINIKKRKKKDIINTNEPLY